MVCIEAKLDMFLSLKQKIVVMNTISWQMCPCPLAKPVIWDVAHKMSQKLPDISQDKQFKILLNIVNIHDLILFIA